MSERINKKYGGACSLSAPRLITAFLCNHVDGLKVPNKGILPDPLVLEYCSVAGRLNKRSASIKDFEAAWKKATSLF